MKRKGYILTWDSLIALSIVLIVMVSFIRLQYSTKRTPVNFEDMHFSAEDAMETLNKKGVLEEITFQWASGNYSRSGNLSKEYLDQILPPYVGYRLEVINYSKPVAIYESGPDRLRENKAKEKTNALRFISGYRERDPRQGWTARAWLLRESTWVDNLACQNLLCSPPKKEINITYAPGGSNFFYLRVRKGSSLVNASFNITWSPGAGVPTTTATTITGTTTTSTTATTTSTTTTTTLLCNNCGACGMGSGFYTVENYYNYHYFDVPPNCDATVRLTNAPGSQYDLYINWTAGYCPKSDLDAYPAIPGPEVFTWIWSPLYSCFSQSTCTPFCNSYMRNGGSDGPSSCNRTLVPQGRYYAMVDCFSYYPDLCGPGQQYTISVEYSGAGCVTTTSTTVTTTTVTTLTTTTTITTTTTSTTTTVPGSTTTTTTTSTTTTTVPFQPCSKVPIKTSVGPNKLRKQDHVTGTQYNLNQGMTKPLSSDDIASGCSWSCYNDMTLKTAQLGCPEDNQNGTPYNVKNFNITVYIPSNVDIIKFRFVVAPEDSCQGYVGLGVGVNNVWEMSSGWIGFCEVNPADCPITPTPTSWTECEFPATKADLSNAGVKFDSNNELTVVHKFVGGPSSDIYFCFSAQPSQRLDFMHFDIINITCTYT